MRTITSTQNAYIKELKQLKNKKGRKSGRFLAEGEKCAQEAILYADVESILVTREDSPSAIAAEAKGIGDIKKQANYYRDSVIPAMNELRAPADEIESLVGEKYWPYPTYGALLFYVM